MLRGCGKSSRSHFVTLRDNFICSDIERTACWQEDSEASDTFPSLAVASEGNAAVVLLRDAFANPESEAGPFSGFCAEERFKESFCVLRLDAASGINNGNGNPAPLCDPVNPFPY